MHPGLWEKLADTFFWLQLFWLLAGFLLMAYLALKVMPRESNSKRSRSGPRQSSPRRPELVVLGGYRFEVTQDPELTGPNVIELRPDQMDRRSRAR
ncbi:MAG TPA: hypothetical protein VG498_06165 [Terriglobales bacterium]|nr:hypothetical protein [Terriglobales bacterium]